MQPRETGPPLVKRPDEAPDWAGADRVAVLVAAYRAAKTVTRTVASALAQPEAAEVIVVDDASADNGATIAAARSADDGSGRLTIIELKSNGGPARARNIALASARSPWVCVLDSDDFMEPGRLAALLRQSHDRHDFVADDLMQVPEGGDPSERRALWFGSQSNPIDVDLDYFVRGNIPHPDRPRRELGFLKPLMRREFLDRHGLRYREDMRLGEDYDLYARALALGARFRLVPAAGYVSVLRRDSLSAQHKRSDLAAFCASDDRLLALPGLSRRARSALRAHRLSVHKKLSVIDCIEALKEGRLLAALGIVLRDPRQTGYVLASLSSILSNRISAGGVRTAPLAERAADAQPAFVFPSIPFKPFDPVKKLTS